jgi:hypothetical protein
MAILKKLRNYDPLMIYTRFSGFVSYHKSIESGRSQDLLLGNFKKCRDPAEHGIWKGRQTKVVIEATLSRSVKGGPSRA